MTLPLDEACYADHAAVEQVTLVENVRLARDTFRLRFHAAGNRPADFARTVPHGPPGRGQRSAVGPAAWRFTTPCSTHKASRSASTWSIWSSEN